MCSYKHGTCLLVFVCIPVNIHVLCAYRYTPVGKSPTISAALLVSPSVRQGAWVGGLRNSGVILGSCQVNYGLCSQVPQSREQVVPGLPSFLLPRAGSGTGFWVGTSLHFYLLGWAASHRLPPKSRGGSVGEVSTLPLTITLTPLFSPVHFNRIYA